MNDQQGLKGLKSRWRAKAAYAAISLCAVLLALLLAVITVCFAQGPSFAKFVELGLFQPIVAALLALAIVMGIWVAKGRYTNERRKGVSSASSSTIAVRLWAICFALLLGAMLLSAFLARLPPDVFTPAAGAMKPVEARGELRSSDKGPAASASVKVTR
jgi:hypothetical protein